MNRFLIMICASLCLLSGYSRAQDDTFWIDPETGDFANRVQRLEAETAELRAELAILREQRPASQGDLTVPVTNEYVDATAAPPDEEGLYYGEDLLKQMRELVWTKGDFKIVPYGNIWGSAAHDTQRVFPGAFVLYVFSEDQFDHDTFVLDTRRTRLGLDITGPKIPRMHNANSRGKVEIDFHGQFVNENQATIQIRHAYAEVYDDNFRLLAGQTSDLMSPLLTRTVNYSVGWAGGNIGFRRMQVRYERYLNFTDTFQITPAVAVCQNVINEGVTGLIDPRSPTNWPIIESRIGCTLGPRGAGCKPVQFGVSGHIGEQGFEVVGTPQYRVRTWSFNTDVAIPVTKRLSFQAEYFTGADLATFLGGIVQGVNFTRREAIYSSGGWFDVGYDWTDDLHSYTGFGIDDPWNDTLSAAAARSYNQFIFTNAIYDVTEKMKLGVELSAWRTQYLGLAPGETFRVEFSGQYEF